MLPRLINFLIQLEHDKKQRQIRKPYKKAKRNALKILSHVDSNIASVLKYDVKFKLFTALLSTLPIRIDFDKPLTHAYGMSVFNIRHMGKTLEFHPEIDYTLNDAWLFVARGCIDMDGFWVLFYHIIASNPRFRKDFDVISFESQYHIERNFAPDVAFVNRNTKFAFAITRCNMIVFHPKMQIEDVVNALRNTLPQGYGSKPIQVQTHALG